MPERSGAEAKGDRATSVTGDQVVHLTTLWKAFEESGAVSAYIAYRRQLSRLIRSGDGPVAFPT